MCDGSVRFVRNEVNLATWQAWGTIEARAGEAIPQE